ncbi:hypothetical protein E4U60_004764 [Claviceps pazoutovae]|uniref:Uncharacterized protein n=1 Tax=Claviceps pazoutovae TaxID=1649127 RepID=A0A9P7MKR9_9HYPO|nr:hypothetical protein E4U60_004764 [Claviceps pazoutovae]
MKAHSVFNILLLAAASLAHNITLQTGKRHEKCRRAIVDNRPGPLICYSIFVTKVTPNPVTTPVLLTKTVSSTTTVVFTVTETAYQTATTTLPASASQPNTVRFARARQNFNSNDHEGHEHSKPPANPSISVIKHNPKVIDLTTNTKYTKHHSRHKIHLNQISRTLTIEAACRRPGRYLPACLHIIGNEPCLTILPTPTSFSTMTESLKYPVVTVSKVVTAHIVSLVVVTMPVEDPKVMSVSV